MGQVGLKKPTISIPFLSSSHSLIPLLKLFVGLFVCLFGLGAEWELGLLMQSRAI